MRIQTGIKLILSIAVGTGLIACTKTKLDTPQKQASYAIGQQIGKNMKSQNVDVDVEALALALKDSLKGEKPRLTDEEMQKALMELQKSTMEKQNQVAEKNKTDGAAFLEKNKSTPNLKVTASGLQYIVEKEGDGKTPTKGDTVKAHYKGTLIDGQVFDSSYDRGQPAEFPVGGVIPGWQEALQLMKVGSKYKLFIPSDMAYGPSGRPGIPPNSVLIFEVELLDVVNAKK